MVENSRRAQRTADRPTPGRVCALVVSYHPDPDKFPDILAAHAAQAGRVLVIDNASPPECRRWLAPLCERLGATLIANETNVGLAAAYNAGVREAERLGCDHMILFDDDTTPSPWLVEILCRTYAETGDDEYSRLVSCLHPDPVGFTGPFDGPPEDGNIPVREVPIAISSCTFMSVADWRRIGPFREDYFIDQIDHEFCLRARAGGYRIFQAQLVGAIHPLGAKTRHRLFGVTVNTTNHSALRLYYKYRNFVDLARVHAATDVSFIFLLCRQYLKEVVVMTIFEKRRKAKWAAIFCGLRDGLMGRLGPGPGTGKR